MKSKSQGGTMARTRRELSTEAIRLRIEEAKMLLAMREKYPEYRSPQKWKALLKRMGKDASIIEASMRIVKRFGDSDELIERMLRLELPFNTICDLSNPNIPMAVVLQFLSRIRKRPSQAECTNLLKEINDQYAKAHPPSSDKKEEETVKTQDEILPLPHPESTEEIASEEAPDEKVLFQQCCEQFMTLLHHMQQRYAA